MVLRQKGPPWDVMNNGRVPVGLSTPSGTSSHFSARFTIDGRTASPGTVIREFAHTADL
jgi:hypothetical protein